MSRQFPSAVFHNIYGSTEINDSFILTLGAEDFAAAEKLGIGRPIAGTDYYITEDPDEPGTGELFTATPFAASGYTDPEQTLNAFLPRLENERLVTYFRTGDAFVQGHAAGQEMQYLDAPVRFEALQADQLVRHVASHHPLMVPASLRVPRERDIAAL